jgi:ribonucleoside-diphosphate reductase alpha chain
MNAETDPAVANPSRHVWETRYRHVAERDIDATWHRVARAVAAVETNPALWTERFLSVLRGFRFLPGGRILAGAGTDRQVTLANCFVMGPIDDSLSGIFDALKEGALTLQQGGGIGYDFSTLRPRGCLARTTGAIASGPVSFMHVWDAMCATVLSGSARGGSMMATLRCDHPDIEAFIDAKRAPDALRHFNLSVQITEQFMQAVMDDAPWPLVFPDDREGTLERFWNNGRGPVPCRIHRIVRARDLWKRVCSSAYDCAEPGVLFIDRINGENNLAYCEQLTATNPCAEEPLPPYGACVLGSLNLTAFVASAFSKDAHFDEAGLHDTARGAVRFLDDVLELSKFPLERQRELAHRSRRVGLGITGLADALAMLGLRYDSEDGRAAAARVMCAIRDAAYEASTELDAERGAFPLFVAEEYLKRPFIKPLPKQIRDAIARHGIRNSHLLAIAPAGSISMLANGISSGSEPIAGIETLYRVAGPAGTHRDFQITDFAYAAWRRQAGPHAEKPSYLMDSAIIAPRDHLLMQAALAPYVDGAISKTVSLPRSFPKSGVEELFGTAHLLGLKGCTVFGGGALSSATEYSSTSGRAND